MTQLPTIIKNCLLTTNDLVVEWEDSNTVYVNYVSNTQETVTLMFHNHNNRWEVYACSPNLPKEHWVLMQAYLRANQ